MDKIIHIDFILVLTHKKVVCVFNVFLNFWCYMATEMIVFVKVLAFDVKPDFDVVNFEKMLFDRHFLMNTL